jgi:hypothetical protein
MTAIVDVELTPRSGSSITLFELLEEFADSTPTWSFLEDDSLHYSATRGGPGCVLAHIRYDSAEIIDYAFAGTASRESGSTRLVLIETDDAHPITSREHRDSLIQDFIDAFSAYAESVRAPVEINFSLGDRSASQPSMN